ncbi:glycine/betaine ABC transporter substrate-binding protein [Actinomadura sp. CNU-125]|uniref:ABC transporter substrate-binding protein n=1 Tax=Actinomadura sp. CNU-125 TaxID=1904961 RepID=UPI000967B252|nr:ABC transporter substrate-binding protein [Actinomadura sp. CNU-125]OLT28360.1 glycine/betaine ABC transporter substrate-binding protein [Actinomadura sp. CNU-125]
MKLIIRGAAVGLAAALALTACGGGDGSNDNPLAGGGGDSSAITVGSANFPESSLLGEIYAQALESKGLKVERKFNIGAREVYYDQVVKGGIDVMPEYNGALLTTSVDPKSTAATTEEINKELTAKLPDGAAILDSATAEDKDSVTVTKKTADEHGLKSIADLESVAGQMVIGGPSEFKTRQQGLVGLESQYGLKFEKFQPLDAGAQATLVELLVDDEIQAADLFTTDPMIAEHGLVVLDDPKHVFSAQNVTPLIYEKGVNEEARTALNAVSAKLTTQHLLDMMKRIAVDKDDQEKVAEEWLKQNALA